MTEGNRRVRRRANRYRDMKIAFLDCFSGISGDLFLGSLLDAGLSFDELGQCLKSLPFEKYRLEMRREARNHIFGTRFIVIPEGKEHAHRNLEAIRKIIGQGNLSKPVKEKSIEIFENIARVEGKVHNQAPEEVHFHEVGAVDSIIDIVGTVYGIERLKIEKLYASSLPLGSGFTKTAHGTIPLPAPATLALLEGIPVYDSGIPHEMVTPTGAALVKCLATSFGAMPPMVIQHVGYGAGSRDLEERPNLLRILIGYEQSEKDTETVVVLETNLDDTSPEWLGYLMDRLFEAGALDVVFCPVHMKKNRPGVQVQIIARPDHRDTLMKILFRESTTLGVRFQYSQRRVLKRSVAEVDSPWGKLKVKKVTKGDGEFFFLPEYEACREVALKNDRPLREIFGWVMGLKR
ncbi:MAG: nickel pincer cofactor biosynthesis protein LarC [Deltaproteobacteria bacterium]|nr:nickel pincer cofactor biosynthesis protein LarC [Deltaproteobacteria bacterium]